MILRIVIYSKCKHKKYKEHCIFAFGELDQRSVRFRNLILWFLKLSKTSVISSLILMGAFMHALTPNFPPNGFTQAI